MGADDKIEKYMLSLRLQLGYKFVKIIRIRTLKTFKSIMARVKITYNMRKC